ncbi:MAG: hypothetical protein AAB296_04465 [Candidatus Desantisbacteria bacterium]
MRKNLTVVLGVVSLICLGTITNCEGGFGDWFSKLFGYNPAQEKKIVLNVDDVAADPAAYKGTITVKGVVYSMNTSQKLFTMIDLREYERCKVVTCATKYLKVRWSGNLPVKEKKVMVIGKLREVEITTTSGKRMEYQLEAMEVK